MRPLRFLLSLATCIIAFFLLLYIGPWRASTQEDLEEQSTIGTYFNWRTPSSLFPPSAIISLTDDNSTFFLARPAAFGPLLPVKSLSGQLWIGSGFGDDRFGHGGSGAEGELGCSDVPGWGDGNYLAGGKSSSDATADAREGKNGKRRKRDVPRDGADESDGDHDIVQNDGTDDHLHHPLPPSDDLKTNGGSAGNTKKPTHADIQSLQESAEIAGRVVLLTRGGCGFLEKVKWVQRRGGVALIVGDDIRGGPLVTMYARGDTSNVTIPSLFTSHTTAHLLSTLIPSGGLIDGISPEEVERLGLVVGAKPDAGTDGSRTGAVADKPNFTTTSVATKSTATARAQQKTRNGVATNAEAGMESATKVGWFRSLFGRRGGRAYEDSRRPPSSGNIGWILQKEFEEEEDARRRRVGVQVTSSSSSTQAPTATPDASPDDGFVIGVQDWRDPDLVAEQKEQLLAATASSSSSPSPQSSRTPLYQGPKGGSITPGSGEYVKALHEAVDLASSNKPIEGHSTGPKHAENENEEPRGWFGRFFGSRAVEQTFDESPKQQSGTTSEPIPRPASAQDDSHGHQAATETEMHEGLWVTLTPTSMSSSPFFDTLLVLVVSPLVTLTVVYALLLLRSRIRRRRWRAPKSVVERLPVRTYQTMPSTTSTSSTTSSISSPISVTTPLLPSSARPISGRPRPRSRTASEVPVQPSSSLRSDGMASPSLEHVEEKRAAGLSEWRRRYGGKQKECVVCLEEYVDGVSRVMSLPCGHEFHAECMYVCAKSLAQSIDMLTR